MQQQIKTPLTELLGIKHPIMLAGMNVSPLVKLFAPRESGYSARVVWG